uniref:Uncharacterized protein n=1 Tax=Brassica oleracea var. oleracea TaxID=109376 RepID=A0A0D3BKZ7_BRAOL
MFQDITTVLLDPKAFKDTIDLFVERYRDNNISVVLEYHMEFQETFECIWNSKESDRTKSLAFSRPETHRFDPGATFQSDVPKSLPMFRATCWSDTPRSLASSRPEIPKSSILERPSGATQLGRSRGDDPGATSSERHS